MSKFWDFKEGEKIYFIEEPEKKDYPFDTVPIPADGSRPKYVCPDLPKCIFCEMEQERMALEAIRRCRLF